MTRPVYIVMGFHRTGTSLVASMLDAAGIEMCHSTCKPGDHTQPHGYWEDKDFTHWNRLVLKTAGGNWKDIPSFMEITLATSEHAGKLPPLIAERNEAYTIWGFKDPRTSLTVFEIDWILREANLTPRYIITNRNESDAIVSLIRRNGGEYEEWESVRSRYLWTIDLFLSTRNPEYMKMDFESLVYGDHVTTVSGLAQFIDRQDKLQTMLERIVRRHDPHE